MIKINLKSLLLFFFLVQVFSGYSQNTAIDSLQIYVKKDTIRVNLLNTAAAKIVKTDVEKAMQLYSESESLSNALHFKKGKANSLFLSGRALMSKADYSNAIPYFQNALPVFQELKNREGVADCYLNLGRSYFNLGDIPNAFEQSERAAAISEEAGKLKILSGSLMIMGMVHNNKGEYGKSLELYKRALGIDEKLGNKKGMSAVLLNMANQYKQQGDYTRALESYNQSIELKKQYGDEFGIAANLNNIGTLYQDMENYSASLPYFKQALPIYEKFNQTKDVLGCMANIGLSLMYQNNPQALPIFKKGLRLSEQYNDAGSRVIFTTNIAACYFSYNDLDKALYYYQKSVKLQQELGEQQELSNSYLNIGRIYYAKKDYEKALEVTKKGSEIAKRFKIVKYQMDFSSLLSQIYYSIKEYKLAYESGQEHKSLSDSIYGKENIDKLSQIKYKYAYKDTLNTANKNVHFLKKTVKNIDAQRKWLIIGFVALLIILGFVTALLKIRKVKMQNQQLQLEQKLLITQMNPHFIFNSISNIQQLIYEEKDDDAINYLSKFSTLTRQILENSNENYISLTEEVQMISNYLSIQQLLYSNKFNFTITVADAIDPETIFLPPMLTQPFIENAIKHGLSGKSANGEIDIRFYLNQEKLYFEVLDNGKGFEAKKPAGNHKSLAMTITKERLVNYTKNQNFVVQSDNITDTDQKVVGARVIFEIPYIYEN